MADNRLWYIAKVHDIEDTDADVCCGIGSIYCVKAPHASAAVSEVNSFLEKNPQHNPYVPMHGTVSARESVFLRPVGNQPAASAQEDGVYVWDENVTVYNDMSQKHAWRNLTRNARVKAQYPVESFDSAVDQFVKYPSRFENQPSHVVSVLRDGFVDKTRQGIETKLQSSKYTTFVRGLQGQPFSEETEHFVDSLSTHEKGVLNADLALAEIKSYTFFGRTFTPLCLPSGDDVCKYSFPDLYSEDDNQINMSVELESDDISK